MKVLKLEIYLLCFSVFMFVFLPDVKSQSHSQTHTFTGKVFAFKNMPLNKVAVTSKETGLTVYTDSSGIFSISSFLNDKLIFQCQGFQKNSVRIKSQKELTVKLIFKDSKSATEKAVSGSHVETSAMLFHQTYYAKYNTHLPDSLLYPSRFSHKLGSKKFKSSFPENNIYSTNNNHMSSFYSNYYNSKKW